MLDVKKITKFFRFDVTRWLVSYDEDMDVEKMARQPYYLNFSFIPKN
jgi:hypothetical protein